MSHAILSTLLLLLVPRPSGVAVDQPPSLVEPETGAWATIHAGQLWVCWVPGPDCFERIVLDEDPAGPDFAGRLDRIGGLDGLVELDDPELLGDGLDDPPRSELDAAGASVEPWRLGFGGPQSLWIERGEQRWRVVAGQRRGRRLDDPAPIRLRRVTPPTCGPAGLVPALIDGRLRWKSAPPCPARRFDRASTGFAQTCVTSPPPRLRAPTPVRVRASLELVSGRAWTRADQFGLGPAVSGRRRIDAVSVSFVIELGFDPRAAASQRRARAQIARSRAPIRSIPAVDPGPRASAEHEALARIVCGERQP